LGVPHRVDGTVRKGEHAPFLVGVLFGEVLTGTATRSTCPWRALTHEPLIPKRQHLMWWPGVEWWLSAAPVVGA